MGRPTSMEIGSQFGFLTVLERTESPLRAQTKWLCRCVCGVEKSIYATHLRSGNIVSCGCKLLELQRIAKTTHGLSKSRIRNSYQTMKQRCLNPNAPDYPRYGGRGIKICGRWLAKDGFLNFMADMGERPEGYSLDRLNNDGDYTPENCVWSTSKMQIANRNNSLSITYDGRTMSIPDWAREVGLKPTTLYMRVIKHGWPIPRALGLP